MPHTRAPKVSGLVNQAHLKALLLTNGVSLTTYRGPASVHSTLLVASGEGRDRNGQPVGTLPFYLRSEANPRMCVELVLMLNNLLGIQVDVEKLRRAAEQTDRALARLVSENPHLRSLGKLEEQHMPSRCLMNPSRAPNKSFGM